MLQKSLFVLVICVFGFGAMLSGCEEDKTFSDATANAATGDVSVKVDASALTAAAIQRIEVVITGDGLTDPMTVNLVQDIDGDWMTADPVELPVGAKDFTANAYDDATAGTVIYTGTASATITAHETTTVVIYMQEDDNSIYENNPPAITSLVATPNPVGDGEDVSLSVVASDPDGDITTKTWAVTPNNGTWSATTGDAVTWTSPLEGAGSYDITVSVSDAEYTVTQTVTVVVEEIHTTGDVDITVIANSNPVVTSINNTDGRTEFTAAGQSVSMDVAATDPEGDTLSYLWSADGCLGGFNNTTVRNPMFFFSGDDVDADGQCRLVVTISDGNGGSKDAAKSFPINM